jgi:lysophospholipase L1-like esterase
MNPRILFAFAASFLVAPLLPAVETVPAVTMPAPVQLPAHDPHFSYMGRCAFDAAGAAALGFPGVTIRFAYRGPAPTLLFNAGSPYCAFNLSVNGWEPVVVRLPEGPSEFVLPSGVAPAEGWVVELVRRNEAWQGVATLRGVRLPPGCELRPVPALPKRKLLFIGDSMTGGERIDRLPPENDDTPRTANASRAFGMLLGRRLEAQVHLVSYGGRGVMRDWQGKTDTATAPEFFERTLPDDARSRWDHRAYVPDAVVICLGQNDLNAGLIDEAVFTAAYERLVARIHEVYPKAGLVLAESALQSEDPASGDAPKRALLRRCIETIVARQRAAGFKRIAVAPVHKQPGTAVEGHPVAFQHEQIALQLLGPLKQVTGW